MRKVVGLASLFLAGSTHALVAAAQIGQPREPAASCDRACLIRLADAYLDALGNGEIGAVPFAPFVRFVENAERKRIGTGLWESATATPRDFRIHVPDPVSGQIGVIAMVEEQENPVELGLRLRVDDERITEAEHLIARDLDEHNLGNLQSARPAFLASVPIPDRVSRDALLDIAYSYYIAVDHNDGSAAPFAADCELHENGIPVTGRAETTTEQDPVLAVFGAMGCKEQLDTRFMGYIDKIEHRRVEIADVETGLAFGLSHARHSMTNKTLKILGVPGIDSYAVGFDAFDRPAAHIFKVSRGELHEIEAIGFTAPHNSPTGWE